jgi:hypothetical protein
MLILKQHACCVPGGLYCFELAIELLVVMLLRLLLQREYLSGDQHRS